MENNKLNPEIVDIAKKKFEKRKDIVVEVNTGSEIIESELQIVTNISPTRMNRLVVDYIETIMSVRKRSQELADQSLEIIFTYMLIKHLTDMETPNTFEDQIILINNMLDLGLIEQILSEFDPKEIEYVFTHIEEATEAIINSTEEMEKMKEQIEESGEEDANIQSEEQSTIT